MIRLPDLPTFGDLIRQLAESLPDTIALRDDIGRSRTYREFNRRCKRLNAAVAELGLRSGDRVAILSRNRLEYAETFGLAMSGIVMVPLNWRLSADELFDLLEHCAPAAIFADANHIELLQPFLKTIPKLRALVCFDGAVEALDYEALVSHASPPPPQGLVTPWDPLCIIYTSGTTGKPKGATLSHAGALANMRIALSALLCLEPEDRVLATMPFFHVGGLWYHFFPSFASGCTTTVLPEFSPEHVLSTMEHDKISVVHLVPTMVGALLDTPDFSSHDLSALRRVFYAGSPMPTTLLRRAMAALPQCGFLQAYGSTEAGIVSTLTPEDHQRALGSDDQQLLLSCGKPVEGCTIRITTEVAGCADGEVGEIEVNSPYGMAGYWHDPTATEAVRPSGWLKTGDLGYRNEEEYLFLVDRKSDMIVTGGENVFPAEVEDHLLRLDGVAEASVFGVPDAKWIESVTAAVVLKPGATVSAQHLINTLRAELAHYKCPKKVHFVDALPKSGVGKVLRQCLRQQFSPEDK